MVDPKYLVYGVVSILIGSFIFFTLFNNLFTPVNNAVVEINETFTCGLDDNCTATGDNPGFSTTGNLIVNMWSIIILALAIAPVGLGVALIYKAIKM